jgi:hypothetical protein
MSFKYKFFKSTTDLRHIQANIIVLVETANEL